ncbi:MAG: helix-turn-helix domain-containing protein [Burkholderiaceae bacterium]|nr:helix-turn-helix domain-containing protein [Burkholderiaceae bacterium]
MDTIGARIARARLVAGLSQDGLARTLKITRPAVSLWETGQTTPSQRHLVDIARVLGVTVDWLLHGDATGPADTDEVTLLRLYRRIPAEDRTHLLRILRALDAESEVRLRLQRAETVDGKPR